MMLAIFRWGWIAFAAVTLLTAACNGSGNEPVVDAGEDVDVAADSGFEDVDAGTDAAGYVIFNNVSNVAVTSLDPILVKATGEYVYLISYAASTLGSLDFLTYEISYIPVGLNPADFILQSIFNNKVYTVNQGSGLNATGNSVTIADMINNTIENISFNIYFGSNSKPMALAFDDPASPQYILTLHESADFNSESGRKIVSTTNLTTKAVEYQKTVAVDEDCTPLGMEYLPAADEIWVFCQYSGSQGGIVIYQYSSRSLVDSVDLNFVPEKFLIDSALQRLFISSMSSSRLDIFNLTDLSLIQTFTPTEGIGEGSWAMALHKSVTPKLLFLINRQSNNLSIIDIDSNLWLQNYPLPGNTPYSIALASINDKTYLYILNRGSSDLNIYEITVSGSVSSEDIEPEMSISGGGAL